MEIGAELDALRRVDVRAVDGDGLADLLAVPLDGSGTARERAVRLMRQLGNPYCFRAGDIVVKVNHNEEGPTFQECLEGLLRGEQ